MSDLDAALLDELRLRSRLNALIRERADALAEADRLDARAGLPGAEDGIGDAAGRWRAVADRVAGEVEEQRAALRRQEAVVEQLRAPGEG